MFSERLVQRRSFGAWGQSERGRIEREQPEKVTVRTATLRRTRPSVPASSEIVWSRLAQRSVLVAFRERVDIRRNVPDEPVVECPARCVGIVHDQGKTLRFGRLARPAERRRDVASVTCKPARYLRSVGEALDYQFE